MKINKEFPMWPHLPKIPDNNKFKEKQSKIIESLTNPNVDLKGQQTEDKKEYI